VTTHPRLADVPPHAGGDEVHDGLWTGAPEGPLETLEGVDHDVPGAGNVEEGEQEGETQLPRAELSDHLGHDIVLLRLLFFFRPLRVGRHCAQQGNALCKNNSVQLLHAASHKGTHTHRAASTNAFFNCFYRLDAD